MKKTNYYHCSKCGKEGTKKTVYFNDNYDVVCVKGCKPSDIKAFEEKQKQQIAEKCITNRIASLYCKAKQMKLTTEQLIIIHNILLNECINNPDENVNEIIKIIENLIDELD